MPVFENTSSLACSVEGLFDFMSRPKNVVKVSNPDLGIKFVSPPETLSQGVELEFQIASFGQIHTLKYQVVEFSSPSLIVEEQLEGPMKAWRHHHIYQAGPDGCSKIDRVEFEPPGGMIGFFLTEAKIIDQLEDGMFIRDQKLKEFIEQGVIS